MEHNIELPIAEVLCTARQEAALRAAVDSALELGKGVVHAAGAVRRDRDLLRAARLSQLRPRLSRARSAAVVVQLQPGMVRAAASAPACGSTSFDAEQTGEEAQWSASALDAANGAAAPPCPGCHGARLNPVALHLRFRERSIAELTALPVGQLRALFARLRLGARESAIARDALAEIGSRLAFLERVGLGYLSLDRAAPTLSGGEAQRIRLAAQLGSNLQGVCYVLDEPTIGLHPRDNAVLLDALDQLAAAGNTLVVVEHDEDTIRRADHVIDLGPGAGVRGGRVVAAGTARALQRNPESVTGRFLARPLRHPADPTPRHQRPQRSARDRSGESAQPARHRRAHSARPAGRSSPACPVPASHRWRATCSTPTCARW